MSELGFEPTPTEVDCDLNAAPYSPVNLGLDPKQIATESFSFAFITLKAHE